jgi:sugar-phosphatase
MFVFLSELEAFIGFRVSVVADRFQSSRCPSVSSVPRWSTRLRESDGKLKTETRKLETVFKLSCAAILFDLDGVLIESRPAVERQWAIWAREHNLDPEKVIPIAHGRPTIETIREVAPQLDADIEAATMEQREISDLEGVRAIPGAADLLARIPPDRWAVVTSATRDLAITRLRYVGLPAPRTMVSASDITHGKPDPEPYLKGAAALRFQPRECLVIEDAPSGIKAGQAAGMRVIAVPTTYAVDELRHADVLLKRLSDLRLTVANTPGRQAIHLELLVPTP